MSIKEPEIITVRRTTAADTGRVVRTLSQAFFDDPVFEWCLPDADHRRAALPGFFLPVVEAFARHEETWIAPDGQGVALWAPPGIEPIGPQDADAVEEALVEASGPAIERIGALFELMEEHHPTEESYYLMLLSVVPASQGRGLGSTLLRAVLETADREGKPAYLEATSDRNRRLYSAHGFETIEELRVADCPPLYAMWREPRPI